MIIILMKKELFEKNKIEKSRIKIQKMNMMILKMEMILKELKQLLLIIFALLLIFIIFYQVHFKQKFIDMLNFIYFFLIINKNYYLNNWDWGNPQLFILYIK